MTKTELAAAFKQQEQERAKFEEAMKKRKTTLNIYIVKQSFSVSRVSVMVRRVIQCSNFVRGVENVDGSVCHKVVHELCYMLTVCCCRATSGTY